MTSRRPDNACSIWADPDGIYLEFPSPVFGAPSHACRFPATEAGIKQLLTTLKARYAEPISPLGRKGAPTQAQLEHGAKAVVAKLRGHRGPKVSRSEVSAATSILTRMGLIRRNLQ